jgi:catechol 2,3-dioxygenase-like lactoylglutathione lyase family enzyme
MPSVTGNPLSGIDHTLIGVRDLEAARAAWRHLGFAVTPRGRHIGWGTGNYCVMFRDDYVELLGIVDPCQFLNRLDTLLETRGEGLLGLAFAAPSSSDVHAAFPTSRSRPRTSAVCWNCRKAMSPRASRWSTSIRRRRSASPPSPAPT